METVLAFLRSDLELLGHDLLAAVVRELEIVDASHHGGQVVVRQDVGGVERLLDDGQRRRQGLEASNRETRGAGDELQELPLLVSVVRAHDLEQEPDGLRVVVEAVIGLAGLHQRFHIPLHIV